MTPHATGAAALRLLMLSAGPVTEEGLHAIRAELTAFVDADDVATLARTVAIRTARLVDELPDEAPGGFYVGDAADLVAFGMIGHTLDAGPEHLNEHLDPLDLPQRLAVAVSLLSMWRQACRARAVVTLAAVKIPDTAPRGGTR